MDYLPDKLPFSSRKLPKTVVLSYVLDYVIILVLSLAFLALNLVTPFHQHFSLRNYNIQYPYAVHERVPLFLLYAVSVPLPAIIIAVYTLVIDGLFSHSGLKRQRYRFKDRLWELNCGILGLLLSFMLSYIVTGTFKNAIGKPRPDLIARCMPKPGSEDPLPFGVSNSTICTQTDKALLDDGFRSFPSGHSSTSFSGLFYLSLYLAGKLHVLDAKGEVWRTFVVMIPTLGAGLVAGSRIMDARHHPFDVITGSLIGILAAWASYRQYFPPLSDYRAKGRAYPIRTWGRSLSEDAMPSQVDGGYIAPAAQHDEEQHARPAFATGRLTPPEQTEQAEQRNVFREEIHASQRQRHQASVRRGGPSTYSGGPPVPDKNSPTPLHQPTPLGYSSQTPSSNPFSRDGRVRRSRDDIWDVSDEDDETGYELEQTYTLSDPQKYSTGAYEPFRTQDTSYHGQTAAPRRPREDGLATGVQEVNASTSSAGGTVQMMPSSPPAGPSAPPAAHPLA